ncbi:MAG: glycosyltransferase, partial [Acidimicrobiales bacterium]
MADAPTYSVVIPVFNSRDIVAATVADVIAFFDGRGETFEVVLVNDGGEDGSWEVIRGLAQADPRVVAVRFLRNYGQHNANLAGFAETRGTWIVTMDDDGQNPPEEIAHLAAAAEAGGHDVVFGRFDRKKSSLSRALGTRLMGAMNRRIFGKPKDLA